MLAETGPAVLLAALAQHNGNNEIKTKKNMFLHAYVHVKTTFWVKTHIVVKTFHINILQYLRTVRSVTFLARVLCIYLECLCLKNMVKKLVQLKNYVFLIICS